MAAVWNLSPVQFIGQFGVSVPVFNTIHQGLLNGGAPAAFPGGVPLSEYLFTFLYVLVQCTPMGNTALRFNVSIAVVEERVEKMIYWINFVFPMKRSWTTEEMMQLIQDFARYDFCQGVMIVMDFYRLYGFGNNRYPYDFAASNILFATNAKGAFMVAELFDQRNWNELQCFLESWLYQIIGRNPRVPRPAANQIPVMGCRDGAACLTPDELFVGCALSDNQLDMDCEKQRLVNEPHVMTPFPKIWDTYRLVLGAHAHKFNKALEVMRYPVELDIRKLMAKFKTLKHPEFVFGAGNVDRSWYNGLLEAACAVYNHTLAANTPAPNGNNIRFIPNPPPCSNSPRYHICACEMLPTPDDAQGVVLYSHRLLPVEYVHRPPAFLAREIRFMTQGLKFDMNPAQPVPSPMIMQFAYQVLGPLTRRITRMTRELNAVGRRATRLRALALLNIARTRTARRQVALEKASVAALTARINVLTAQLRLRQQRRRTA